MKKTILSTFIAFLSYYAVNAQSCSVSISGPKCVGNVLTATTSSGPLAKLIWQRDGNYAYGWYTVSSPLSISLVAGGNPPGGGPTTWKTFVHSIVVDDAGNVYIADFLNNRVIKWAPGASQGIVVAGGNGAGSAANQLDGAEDIALDKEGNLYVADFHNSRVQKWAPGATSGVTVAGGHGSGSAANQISYTEGVCVDKNHNVYVADISNGRIQKWAPGADSGITVAGKNGGIGYPTDVAIDAAGNLYIADTYVVGQHFIYKWAPGATSPTVIVGNNGTGSGANQIQFVENLAVDSIGNVYLADEANGRIQKWAPGATSGVTVAGSVNRDQPWDKLGYPSAVAINKHGDVFVEGQLNSRTKVVVQKYTPVNGNVLTQYTTDTLGDYRAVATFANGCVATSAVKHIDAPSGPHIQPATPGGKGDLCGGRIDTFFVSNKQANTTYNWVIPFNISMLQNNNDSIIVRIHASFNKAFIKAQGTNGCGTGAYDSLKIFSWPLQPAGIAGPKTVARNQTNIEYSTQDLGFTYTWRVPQFVTLVSGQGTAHIVVNWGPIAGTLVVNATNDCGTSTSKSHAIQVKKRTNLWAGNDEDDDGAATKSSIRGNDLIYPNPAVNSATILFHAGAQAKYTVEVQDVTGKTVMHKEAIFVAGANKIDIDISRYAKGMYFVTVTNAAKQKTGFKLMKQ